MLVRKPLRFERDRYEEGEFVCEYKHAMMIGSKEDGFATLCAVQLGWVLDGAARRPDARFRAARARKDGRSRRRVLRARAAGRPLQQHRALAG